MQARKRYDRSSIFDQTIKNLLIAMGKKYMLQTEENITKVFLDLPLVEITYNKKNKIVTDVVPRLNFCSLTVS